MAKHSPGEGIYCLSCRVCQWDFWLAAPPTPKSFKSVFVTPTRRQAGFSLPGGEARRQPLDPSGGVFPRAVGHPTSPRLWGSPS